MGQSATQQANATEILIPDEILAYAKLTFGHYVPKRRYSGFKDFNERGNGDFIALVAALTIHHQMGLMGKVCSLELTAGDGDNKDLSVRIDNNYQTINLKASAYAPFRPGLNLFVKEEELKKEDFFAYIQCFVHLNEENFLPHIHIPGGCSTKSKLFKQYRENPTVIPNTGGHRGIKIPCDELSPFQKIVDAIDEKF